MSGLGRRSHYRKHLTDAVLHDLPEPDESIGQRIARVVGSRGGNMFDIIVAPPSSTFATDDTAKVADEDDETSTAHDINEKQPQSTDIQQQSNQRATPQLAFLPTKFRKLVWIKRNDFVIVDCGDEEEEAEEKEKDTTTDTATTSLQKQSKKSDTKNSSGGGFRFVITHILYKDQVKHIKSKGLWPADPYFADSSEEVDNNPISSHSGQRDNNILNKGEDNDEDDNDEYYEDNNGIVFDDYTGDDMMVNTNRIATLRVEDSSSSEEDSD